MLRIELLFQPWKKNNDQLQGASSIQQTSKLASAVSIVATLRKSVVLQMTMMSIVKAVRIFCWEHHFISVHVCAHVIFLFIPYEQDIIIACSKLHIFIAI